MIALHLLPVALSCLLLGAHFLRDGHTWLTAVLVSLPLLLFLRERWVPKLFQFLLLLGCLEWLRTLVVLATARSELGLPWGRLALILGVVAVFTAASALVFRSQRAAGWFDRG